jgi:hypothetical protein
MVTSQTWLERNRPPDTMMMFDEAIHSGGAIEKDVGKLVAQREATEMLQRAVEDLPTEFREIKDIGKDGQGPIGRARRCPPTRRLSPRSQALSVSWTPKTGQSNKLVLAVRLSVGVKRCYHGAQAFPMAGVAKHLGTAFLYQLVERQRCKSTTARRISRSAWCRFGAAPFDQIMQR